MLLVVGSPSVGNSNEFFLRRSQFVYDDNELDAAQLPLTKVDSESAKYCTSPSVDDRLRAHPAGPAILQEPMSHSSGAHRRVLGPFKRAISVVVISLSRACRVTLETLTYE